MAKGKNGRLRRKDGVWDPLKSSETDKQRAEAVPKTPQTLSPAYRLAYADEDFSAARNCGRSACSWN
jgi:hypothetical protein